MVLPPPPGGLIRLSARDDLTEILPGREILLGLETLLELETHLELGAVAMTVRWSLDLMIRMTVMSLTMIPIVAPIMAGRTAITTVILGMIAPRGLTTAMAIWPWQRPD
jgi:hypothetical protein